MCTIILNVIILKLLWSKIPKSLVFGKFLSPYNGHNCDPVSPRGPNKSALEGSLCALSVDMPSVFIAGGKVLKVIKLTSALELAKIQTYNFCGEKYVMCNIALL
jgi:hypothetical protein